MIQLLVVSCTKKEQWGSRYTYWYAAYLAFKSSPIWGIGVGQFVWFSLKFSAIDFGDVVHNAYLTVLAENGIVGLSLFLGWITIAAYRFWAVSRRGITEDLRVIAFSGFCAFAMLLFMAMTLSIEYYKILWLLAGSSIALTIDNEILIYHTKRPYSGSISKRYDSLDLRGIK